MAPCVEIPLAEPTNQESCKQQGGRAYILVGLVGHVVFLLQGCYGDVFNAMATDGQICNGHDDKETKLCMKCTYYSNKQFSSWEEKQKCQDECASGNFAGCKGFLESEGMRSLLDMNAGAAPQDKIEPEVSKKQKKQKFQHLDNESTMERSGVQSQVIGPAKIDATLRAPKEREFVQGPLSLHRDRDVANARPGQVQKSSSAAFSMDARIDKTKRSDADAPKGARAQLQISQAGSALLDVGRRANRRSLANVLTATVAKVK